MPVFYERARESTTGGASRFWNERAHIARSFHFYIHPPLAEPVEEGVLVVTASRECGEFAHVHDVKHRLVKIAPARLNNVCRHLFPVYERIHLGNNHDSMSE